MIDEFAHSDIGDGNYFAYGDGYGSGYGTGGDGYGSEMEAQRDD